MRSQDDRHFTILGRTEAGVIDVPRFGMCLEVTVNTISSKIACLLMGFYMQTHCAGIYKSITNRNAVVTGISGLYCPTFFVV